MIEVVRTFQGQRRRYGNFTTEYEIKTDCPEETVLQWCFQNLGLEKVPEKKSYDKYTRGYEKVKHQAYYLRGYYTIKPIEGGFLFVIHKPFDVG